MAACGRLGLLLCGAGPRPFSTSQALGAAATAEQLAEKLRAQQREESRGKVRAPRSRHASRRRSTRLRGGPGAVRASASDTD